MDLLMIGLSHQTAPVAFREQVALDEAGVVRTLNTLRETPHVGEALVLSTCNRTEVYAAVDPTPGDDDTLFDVLADQSGVPRDELRAHTYNRRHLEVAEHLFMVAGGLDSMVVGENQIQAQVREAYTRAVACRTNGPLINKLLHWSLRVGKQVRTRTGIGQGRLSVASVACDLAEKIFADLADRSVLLVGAGDTGELVVTHLRDRGVQNLAITNRTAARAEELVGRLGGRAVPYERLWEALAGTDVLLTSTSATEPIFTPDNISAAVGRRAAPLFVIDIAVPRDVAPGVDGLRNVFLYDIDALQEVVHASIDRRRGEVHRARAMVASEVAKFDGWHRQQQVTPTIVQMREQFERIRTDEMDKLRGNLSEEDFEKVQRATHALVNKLLHHPTVQMKQAARRKDSGTLITAFRQLLGLDEEPSR